MLESKEQPDVRYDISNYVTEHAVVYFLRIVRATCGAEELQSY